MSVFAHLHALLKRLVPQVWKRQGDKDLRVQAEHQERKAAFLKAAKAFRGAAPQNYRFDRDEANER